MTLKTEVAIIGAGPAGIAAALQLKRNHIDCIIFEKGRPGGLLKNAHRVENYPGFPDGISGPQMAELLHRHMERWNIHMVNREVTTVDYRPETQDFFISANGTSCCSGFTVSAGGTVPVTLDWVENLPLELKENIFYEVHPIVREKDKVVLIIGAGDAAFDYALNLSAGNEVIIANRSDRIKALPLLVDRADSTSRISYYENTAVQKVEPGAKKKLALQLTRRDGTQEMEIDYLICAVGRVPRKDYYSSSLAEMAEELKNRGLFFEIGDIANGIYRQMAIAAGNGIEAAIKIQRRLTARQ